MKHVWSGLVVAFQLCHLLSVAHCWPLVMAPGYLAYDMCLRAKPFLTVHFHPGHQQCDVDGELAAWQCVDQSKQRVTQFAGYQEHQCAVKCVPTAPAI